MPSDGGPSFRLWPPVSVGGPLVLGLLVSSRTGDPLATTRVTAALGLLPGAESTTVIDRGPFAVSRNPLYVGLLVGSAGVALVAGSAWALVALPLEWALLRWGAVLPEERYLTAKFGATYSDYAGRVRRWL